MKEHRISFLLEQRLRGQLTDSEAEELLVILQQAEYNEFVTEALQLLAASEQTEMTIDAATLQSRVNEITAIDRVSGITEINRGSAVTGTDIVGGITEIDRVNEISEITSVNETTEIDKNSGVTSPIRRVQRTWFRYAAAVIILLGAGTYVWLNIAERPSAVADKHADQPKDFPSGGNRATLTLADGSSIVLDDAANGALAQQGGTQVLKLNAGQLAYSRSKETPSSTILYNTISTPRGGQYQIVLPDGSKVWLNAASSLRFPISFTGMAREVEVTGEAYFEVAENKDQPFSVRMGDAVVQVLGTDFNINAYHDEPVIKTTLLSGSIKVIKKENEQVMLPGQQALLNKEHNRIKIINNVDLEEVIAWKNGFFIMNNADVATIMRQVSRWYDVDIRYEGEIPKMRLGGNLSRNVNLSEMLKILKVYNVGSRIEGNTIIITEN